MACTMPALPLGAPPHVRRLAAAEDLPLIMSSWLQGQREVAPWSSEDRGAYYEAERARIEARLAAGTTWVLCHAGDASEVIAWACVGRRPVGGGGAVVPVVHWLYVCRLWRRRGVGRGLLAEVLGGPVRVGVRGGDPVRTTGWSKHAGWIGRRLRLVRVPG